MTGAFTARALGLSRKDIRRLTDTPEKARLWAQVDKAAKRAPLTREEQAARAQKPRRKARKQPTVPTEHSDQVALFQWAAGATATHPELRLLFAIPNFAGRIGRLTVIHGAKLKAEGRKRGVPDVMLPVALGDYHGLFIELKRVKGGEVSEEQQQWHLALRQQGYRVEVCKGWESARDVLVSYLTPAPAPARPADGRVGQ